MDYNLVFILLTIGFCMGALIGVILTIHYTLKRYHLTEKEKYVSKDEI